MRDKKMTINSSSPTWQKLRTDPQKLEKLLIRETVIQVLRAWFAQENFHEVETPLMLSLPTTEPYYDLFQTELKIFGEKPRTAYLAPSPELQMKKLLTIPGMENIYQLGKCFRNQEGRGPRHQSEFTMLEYYRSGVGYEKLMDDLEEIVRFLMVKISASQEQFQKKKSFSQEEDEKFHQTKTSDPCQEEDEKSHQTKTSDPCLFNYQGKKYDLSLPFRRLTVSEAMAQYAGLSEDEWLTEKAIKASAQLKGYSVDAKTSWEELFDQILLNEVEPNLMAPTFLHRYPLKQAALARLCADDERFAERFEFWWAGLELANGYGELVDPEEQSARCQEEITTCQNLGKKEITDYDHDFIEALKILSASQKKYAGIAVGVDRLAMIFADVSDISEIVFFPTSEIFSSQE